MTPIIRNKITYIVNSRQVRLENHVIGVYEVTEANILKKGLKIKKCIENALHLVCKIHKSRSKKPVSIAKLMPADYFASS